MKIIFSRKGFDSSAGGCPSPIVDGVPVSLPIPKGQPGDSSYAALGLGELVERTTGNRIAGSDPCHDDPMFADGWCWFGQCGSAEGHLRKQGVGPGDVFVFFGLFADTGTGERHHRIFGYMQTRCCGGIDELHAMQAWRHPARPHPHLSGEWPANNAIYAGPGQTARSASPTLRLTQAGGPLNLWTVPPWLREFGLSYHARPERWIGETGLDSAKRGQEFVCDIGDASEPRRWLEGIVAEIETD